MLEIKNLHASIEDKEILKGLNLTVNAGEVHAIMGPNGSGKSTLASVLAGNESYEVTEGEVIYQGNDLLEMPPIGLRQATAINQQQAIQWINPDGGNLFAKGQSNPLPALQKALGYEPDIVFLLTDNLAAQQTGTADDQTLLAQIAKANTGQTAIHTIQFLYKDAASEHANAIPLLKQLAQQHGGKYTFVDAKDLKTP